MAELMEPDLTLREIQDVLGGEVRWPNPLRQPVRFAALWRFITIKLSDYFGSPRVLDADLVGGYADPAFRTQMGQGSNLYGRWVAAQRAAGRPESDSALRKAAGREAIA